MQCICRTISRVFSAQGNLRFRTAHHVLFHKCNGFPKIHPPLYSCRNPFFRYLQTTKTDCSGDITEAIKPTENPNPSSNSTLNISPKNLSKDKILVLVNSLKFSPTPTFMLATPLNFAKQCSGD